MKKVKYDWGIFWKPFLISLIISFLFYFFGTSFIFYQTIQIISEGNAGNFLDYIMLSLFTLPFTIFITAIPIFFIIKRLLKENPKKVFYFELPILILIYSFINGFNQLFGLMIGGPIGMSSSQLFTLLFLPLFFISVWLFLLTISLYLYYKKNNSKNL
jgi:hypothetical protein